MALRLRMTAVLALLVGVNALFVLALLWGFVILLPTVFAAVVFADPAVLADLFRLPVSPVTYAAMVVLFLVGQLYYGYRRVLSDTQTAANQTSEDIDEVVRRLSMHFDVPAPSTRVVEDETSSCYTVGRFTDATIVLSTGLLESLDADELEAVLAHEVAHVANRDVTLMTVTTLFLEIATRVHRTVRLVPRALGGVEHLSLYERLALRWFLPLSVVVYVVVSPLLLVFPTVADWATRTLSHAREYAADEAAAKATGEPLALATALVTLSETTPNPSRDLRGERAHALCIVPTRLVRGAVTTEVPRPAPSADEPDREKTVASWQREGSESPVSGTHPPVEKRIERLQRLVREMEGER